MKTNLPPGDGKRIASAIDRYFGISLQKSTFGREVVGGLNAFGAMSYILVVNPAVMAATGLKPHSLLVATILASMVGTLIMGLWARLPVALAPGVASNVIFAQIVVLRMGVSYQTAFTMVLMAGIAFTVLSFTRLREKMVGAFPEPLRIGMQCSIGLFIAQIGLRSGGLVSYSARGPSFGSLTDPAVLLALAGLFVVVVLYVRRVPAAFLLSIFVLTVVGLFIPGKSGAMLTTVPSHFVDSPTFPSELFLAFDFSEFIRNFWLVLPVTLYFFLAEFFSATATLVGVTRRGNLMDAEGQIPNARQAYSADGLATIAGAALGTSTVLTYIESAVGVEAGARTGLMAVVVAILFGFCLFLWPLVTIIPMEAVAPTLILVGLLMFEGIRDLDTSCPENSIPPILTILVTVVTMNIVLGLAFGCFAYSLAAFFSRKVRQLSPMLLVLDVIFLVYMVVSASMPK